jgi:hypothetical protein
MRARTFSSGLKRLLEGGNLSRVLFFSFSFFVLSLFF